MEALEEANNEVLLAHLAGPVAAADLVRNYAGLTQLAQVSFEDLQLVRGIGKSKAAAIKSAFLLAQRLSRETYADTPLLESPDRVADLLREQNRAYTVENLQVVLLNARHRLISVERLSQGTLDALLVHPREVFAPAIAKRGAKLILAHNLCDSAHRLCYGKGGLMCSSSDWAQRVGLIQPPAR